MIYWNKETYPTLQSTPALMPGWVLATTGPPLPTKPAETPPPQLADLPTFGPDSFPASESVTVGYYDVSGSTPQQISYSMEINGPYSDWLGLNATAHVEVSASFNFSFEGDPSTTCTIIPTAAELVTVDYHVVLPAWDAPTSPAPSTVAWWTAMIQETVTHEGHHISVYESYRTQMNQAVQTGTCASVEAEVVRIMSEADRVNWGSGLAEYAAGLGLTLESCFIADAESGTATSLCFSEALAGGGALRRRPTTPWTAPAPASRRPPQPSLPCRPRPAAPGCSYPGRADLVLGRRGALELANGRTEFGRRTS